MTPGASIRRVSERARECAGESERSGRCESHAEGGTGIFYLSQKYPPHTHSVNPAKSNVGAEMVCGQTPPHHSPFPPTSPANDGDPNSREIEML